MKQLIASVLLMVPAWALVTNVHAATDKPASAQKTTQSQKKKTTKPQKAVAVAAKGVALGAAVLAPRVLSADELVVAERVHTGDIACELGQYVHVVKDSNNAGHFLVSGKGFSFHMAPVGTSTGAIRLEDQKAGAVWLQIANKSMLMNQKQGKRLADECKSPEQVLVAEAIKKNPPQSLLAPAN